MVSIIEGKIKPNHHRNKIESGKRIRNYLACEKNKRQRKKIKDKGY